MYSIIKGGFLLHSWRSSIERSSIEELHRGVLSETAYELCAFIMIGLP